MKIAVITEHIPSPYAHSINTAKLAQGFFQLGHQVELIGVKRYNEDIFNLQYSNLHKLYGIDTSIKFSFFRDYSPYYLRELKPIGPLISTITRFVAFIFPILKRFFDYRDDKGLLVEFNISKYCKKCKFDLVISRRLYNAVFYNLFFKIPTIIDLHGNKENILKKIVKASNNPYFRGIFTINKKLKENFTKFGFNPDKIKYMDNSIDLNQFNIRLSKNQIRRILNLNADKKLILYAGKLKKERAIDIILNSSKYLNDDEYMFIFLGGNNALIKNWKKFVKKRKLTGTFIFQGFIPKFYIPFYYKSADVLLATYSNTCETIDIMSPVKLTEYMASKNPILVTRIGCIPEIVNEDMCLMVKPDNSKDLAEKIQFILSNNPIREKIINNAYKRAEKYTLTSRSVKILELVKDLL